MNSAQMPGMGDYEHAPILSTADPRCDTPDEPDAIEAYKDVLAEIRDFADMGLVAVNARNESKIRQFIDEIRCRCDEALECEE